MVAIEFDFRRYVALRRGRLEQQLRDGAAYSYVGERKYRRTLVSARPVTMALEATARLWRESARDELLGKSNTGDAAGNALSPQAVRAQLAAKRAAAALGAATPTVHVTTKTLTAAVLGTEDQPYLVVGTNWVEQLSDDELVAQLGALLGHVQNGQVLFATAQYYLEHSALLFVKWIVTPARLTLGLWAKRAQITCDRAALLACRDLRVAANWMVKATLGAKRAQAFDAAAFAAAPSDDARKLVVADVAKADATLAKRLRALAWFAEGALFASATGGASSGRASTADVDDRVLDLLSVL